VEQGRAPETLTAARRDQTGAITRSRPLCRYPLVARLPFLELDRLIEQESGFTLDLVFDFHGQAGFRRLERQCLEGVLARTPRFVLATGGSLVSEPGTFERLLSSCFTVWVRASPEEHVQRVIAQGDMRPMAGIRLELSVLSVQECHR